MTANTYTYSQLSAASVANMAVSQYGLDKILACKFYMLGLHDNYLLEDNDQKYILRIYRSDWRSEEDILFELEWIIFLNTKTDIVAQLVVTNTGKPGFQIDCPEGPRLAAMFRYADGDAPGNSINPDEAQILGNTVAKIHKFSDAFIPQHTRKLLDLTHLLDESVVSIKPFLDSEDFSYLDELRKQLNSSMPELEKTSGMYGLCIGDVNPTNFHIDNNNNITVFDFDQCGYGYRAFEIGKFFSSIRNHDENQSIRETFLDGYQSVRKLSAQEQEAIAIFEIISVIWVMSIQIANVNRIGYKYMEKNFWKKRMNNLKQLVSTWNGEA